jgi:hypothetical protein
VVTKFCAADESFEVFARRRRKIEGFAIVGHQIETRNPLARNVTEKSLAEEVITTLASGWAGPGRVRSASVSLGNSKFNPKDACCGAMLNTCSGGCRISNGGKSRVRRISGNTLHFEPTNSYHV